MPNSTTRSVLCAISAMGTLVWSTACGLQGNGFGCYGLLALTGVLLWGATWRAIPRIGD